MDDNDDFMNAIFTTDYNGRIYCHDHDNRDDVLINVPKCWRFTPQMLKLQWEKHMEEKH